MGEKYYTHCKDICPLAVDSKGRRIERKEDCVSFEKDVLEGKTPIGIVGVLVRLNPKYAATFTGLAVDESSPACVHLINRLQFVLEQHNGMKSSGVHKCPYLSPKISSYCVDSYGESTQRSDNETKKQ